MKKKIPVCLVCKRKYIVHKKKSYGFHQKKNGVIELCNFADGIFRPGQIVSQPLTMDNGVTSITEYAPVMLKAWNSLKKRNT